MALAVQVIHSGCGGITTGDLDQAIGAEGCTVLAFNVGFVSSEIQEMARQTKARGSTTRRGQIHL